MADHMPMSALFRGLLLAKYAELRKNRNSQMGIPDGNQVTIEYVDGKHRIDAVVLSAHRKVEGFS